MKAEMGTMNQQGQLLLRYPGIFSNYPQVVAAESTRHGGVSKAPYKSLNLGIHTPDDPVAIKENRRRFFAACGFSPKRVAGSHQIHGSNVLKVDHPGYFEGYDALITDQKHILLTVTIADCTPILVFDPVNHAAATAHAGWKGTVAGIAGKTIAAMTEAFGTSAPDCLAYIGTCIDQCDFEVDADVADHFPQAHKSWDKAKGKFFVNLKAANLHQLLSTGMKAENIQPSSLSTVTHNQDFFSHRLEHGNTGRMLAAIGLRS